VSGRRSGSALYSGYGAPPAAALRFVRASSKPLVRVSNLASEPLSLRREPSVWNALPVRSFVIVGPRRLASSQQRSRRSCRIPRELRHCRRATRRIGRAISRSRTTPPALRRPCSPSDNDVRDPGERRTLAHVLHRRAGQSARETTVETQIDNSKASQSDDAHVPRFEPWLGVASSGFVPIGVMFILPTSFSWPMIGLAGVLVLSSVVMLIRQERSAKPGA
jgi:hypothetical protein